MSELLTREKQFIKLNQELDRMAITTTATGHEKVTTPKIENRFQTFHKSKGPSTLLRNQGPGGDGHKQNSVTTNNKESKRSEAGHTCSNNRPHNESVSTNSAQHRFTQNKCTERLNSQLSNSGRVSTSRMIPANNSTFSIKYVNKKFLESPSLEVLVKEESSSLRWHTDAVRMSSPTSTPTDEGILTGKPSQCSYHTVSSKKNVSSEGLIKFLKSKIVILEEDHQRLTQDMSEQKELFEKTLEHNKILEQQRDQAKSKNNALSEQLSRSEKKLEEANKLLQERSIDQNAQSKELETAKREFKLLTQTNANLEKRLFRANEDLENVRKALSEMKANEREQREAARKDAEIKETQIKSLKKQRANLLNAYKKQLFLIDNLKRQNILLEQAKMLDIGEKEFTKVLDWEVKK